MNHLQNVSKFVGTSVKVLRGGQATYKTLQEHMEICPLNNGQLMAELPSIDNDNYSQGMNDFINALNNNSNEFLKKNLQEQNFYS